ncbi:hypothetical protein B566_EDAN001705 [Ephemera danica]|nr:hypothetical protein B566_EDAN001705 [Ephemera danica]
MPARSYYGKLVGKLKEYAHGIRGTVDPPVLPAFNNVDIILHLPFGKRLKDIKWLSVWCRRFTVNFGDVLIPPSLEVPRPRMLPEFKRLAHGLRSGNISILDAKTFYIPNLHYDGAGPDAYFWVGNGTEPGPLGMKVPNERGRQDIDDILYVFSLEVLRGYQGEDIEIQLPGNRTVYDIDWLAIWCVRYRHNFGHVMIPKDLDVPPALGQTKITTTSTTPDPMMTHRMTNCRELLPDKLQVQWELQGDTVEIQLSGRIAEDQYMSFGISGEMGRSTMIGGDVVVAFYDKSENVFQAFDYHMSSKSQCDGRNGVCPDERIGGRNDVSVVLGERRDGITTISYKRPLQTNELTDRNIPSNNEVNVIAAIGLLNNRKEANAHLPQDETKGQPSWGKAWYINDKLIPEIYVERGSTYTFIVEGGNKDVNPSHYHPFYITDSKEGGFEQKNIEERKNQRIYAGVGYDTNQVPYPTAAGRYCEWAHTTIDRSSEFETFDAFFKTLRLDCEDGEPAYLNWTVDPKTPDVLYYQCYIHSNYGWKIHVVDAGYQSRQSATLTTPGFGLALLLVSLVLLLSR